MNNWLALYLIIVYVGTTYLLVQHISVMDDNSICDFKTTNETLCRQNRNPFLLAIKILFFSPLVIIYFVRDLFLLMQF
jgi:hypothetical protein